MTSVYWDSCVLIYRIQGLEPWNRCVDQRLKTSGNLRLNITDLTRLECRLKPLRENDTATLTLYDCFFARADIYKIPMTPALFDLATELRANHRLSTPDALHLAAAINARCREFWTNDRRLATAADDRIKIIALAD